MKHPVSPVPSVAKGSADHAPRRWLLTLWTVTFVLSVLSTAWMWKSAAAASDRITDITEAAIELENAMGYTGLIHNFKNALLRPGDPRYLARAARDHARATAALGRLVELSDGLGQPLDVALLTETLDEYRDSLPAVAAGHASGMSIREIDQRVRIPDAAAGQVISQMETALVSTVRSQARSLSRLSWLTLAIMGLVAVAVFREMRINANEAANARELANRQLEVEKERVHAEELRTVLDQLDQSHRELADFTHALSHDLKSPTQTARMIVDMLRYDLAEASGADLRSDLDDLDRVLVRMEVMIRDVLCYTKSLDQPEEIPAVDLNAVVAEVLNDLRAEIRETGANIRREPLPVVPGRPNELRRLVQNLIGNALKYRRSGVAPLVTISMLQENGTPAGFEVNDNGIGIAEEYRDRIFGAFSRLHAQDDIPGTGLGLSICRRIAVGHGGAISVRESRSGGSVFSVSLPGGTTADVPRQIGPGQLADAAPTSDAMIRATTAQSSSENVSGNRRSISPSSTASVLGRGSDAA